MKIYGYYTNEMMMKKLATKKTSFLICLLSMSCCLFALQPVKSQTVQANEDTYRPILPSDKPEISDFLKTYEIAEQNRNFAWKIIPQYESKTFQAYSVTFPSPCAESTKFNKTVFCEYIQSITNSGTPRPAVVILHGIGDNGLGYQRRAGKYFAKNGMDSLLIKLPYHGQRRDPQMKHFTFVLSDPTVIITAFRQAAMDIRRGARFLAQQKDIDPKKIYIVGHSLGGIVGSLTVGVDGYFPKAVFTIAGADIIKTVEAHSAMFPPIGMLFKKHKLEGEVLQGLLKPVEPLTYAARARNTKVLMLNAKHDRIVPTPGSKKLAAEFPNAQIYWEDENHASFDRKMHKYLPRITKFLLEEN